MVSQRCKMAVMGELKKIGLQVTSVDLGFVSIEQDLTKEQKEEFRVALLETGLELIENKKDILVELIKTSIIAWVHCSDNPLEMSFSTYLTHKLNLNYTYLSNTFSESEGSTIAHFIITHKIERVKELIQYDEMTFSEIAFVMHYSSIAHLSNQFKKMTGTTLSHYKSNGQKREVNIENL
jgi:YesN/AraC family two-component response regulator